MHKSSYKRPPLISQWSQKLKFIHSEKATFPRNVHLTMYVVSVKNKENISQDVAAFSEYMQHCSYLEFSSPLKKQTNYCTGPDYICTTIYSIKQTETYN